jgi:hypothetical protein
MIHETLNAYIYENILDEKLLEFDGVEDMICTQNLAPCHKAVFKVT